MKQRGFLWMHTHWHMVSIEKKVDDYPDDWIGCRYKAAVLKCCRYRILGPSWWRVTLRHATVLLQATTIGPQLVNEVGEHNYVIPIVYDTQIIIFRSRL